MPAAPTKNAKPAPAPEAPIKGKEVAATEPKLYRYYRVRKLSGFLSELLEVEIDESQVKPKVITKQDDRGMILDRARDVLNDNAKAGK